jgi:signal transduction histidine kinase
MGKKRLFQVVVMVILLAGVCLATYYFHVILKVGAVVTHFYYIPIILASLWWRKGGIIVAVFLAVMLLLSHNFLRTDVATFYDYFRAVMFLVVAVVVATLGEQYAKTIEENLDYQDKLRSLASELSLVEERGKRRIAVEMHDHFGQDLALSRLKLEEIKSSLPCGEFTEELDKISTKLKQNIKSLRSLTFELCSPTLYELGFEKAVNEWLTERIQKECGIETEFNRIGQLEPLDEDISIVLFQVVRELLINVIKHAQASFVKVTTEKKDNEIKVIVQDNGAGFDPCAISLATKKSGQLGLFSVRERIGYLGGKVEIESAPGSGSRITIILPLKSVTKK